MRKKIKTREKTEPGGGVKQKLKTKLAGLALLGTFLLGKVGEGMAQEVKTEEKKQNGKEIVMQQDSTSKEVAKTLDRFDADSGGGPGIEPDPDTDEGGDTAEVEPEVDQEGGVALDDGSESDSVGGTEKVPDESPTKFTISTGVGYSIGGQAFMGNRIAGSGTLLKGTKGEMFVYSHMDFDDPLHSKGSRKLTLSKSIYKGISLDGDYTFTGSGGNVVRLGIGYGGKIGDGMYGIKIYPLNTGGSPISAKVSYSTKMGPDGQLSSFIFVDFGNMQYYSETEYVYRIIESISRFLQLRLGGIIDGSIGSDSQKIVGGVKISVK